MEVRWTCGWEDKCCVMLFFCYCTWFKPLEYCITFFFFFFKSKYENKDCKIVHYSFSSILCTLLEKIWEIITITNYCSWELWSISVLNTPLEVRWTCGWEDKCCVMLFFCYCTWFKPLGYCITFFFSSFF